MSNIRDKQKLLSLLQHQQTNFVEQMFHQGGCEYGDLITVNAHNSGAMSYSDIENVLGHAYKIWYNRIVKSKPKTDIQRALQSTLIEESQYQPNNIAMSDGFIDFFTIRFANEFPMSDSPVVLTGSMERGFFHIWSSKNFNIECRLYLNLMSKHIAEFSTLFINECEKRGLPYYFKFCMQDDRNDRLPIYTNYEHGLNTIKVIKHIEKTHSYLFAGADNINPMLAKVDKFIGFGEDPVYEKTSFNKSRADAIDKFIKVSRRTILQDIFKKPILNNARTTSEISLDNYICQYITSELRSLAKPLDVDVDSPENQETIHSHLSMIYDNIIAGNKNEYLIPLITSNNSQKIISAKTNISDKLMSLFRISNRLSNNARLTALIENIYISALSKHIVTTDQGVSMPFDKFVVDTFRNRALEILSNESRNQDSNISYNAKIAIHEIKCNTELGRLAIMRAVASYAEHCSKNTDPMIELDLSPVSMDKFSLGQGFTDIFFAHCPKDKSRLNSLMNDHDAKLKTFALFDVNADYPFLNDSTVRQISTISKLVR